jgi:GNAT superfamily N-acetyltransferase
VQAPETRYASSKDGNVAYQVVGDGPRDLVFVSSWVSNVDDPRSLRQDLEGRLPMTSSLPSIRKARLADVPALERLIAVSARVLGADDYRAEQIEAALQGAWGVDTEIIRDGTYFVGVDQGELVVCGGWSRRATCFGGDAYERRESRLLDAKTEAARIRAFFVHPARARHGLATRLLAMCEGEARAEGFAAAELVATLPGERFYARHGYVGSGRRTYPLPGGQSIDFVPMRRAPL